jgi:hypothetical protein
MKVRSIILLASGVSTIIFGFTDQAGAIPLFARKYNTTCFTCHTSEPLLNDFGRRFQAAGYQLPGAGSDPETVFDQTTFPLALLAQPRISHTQITDRLMNTTTMSTSLAGVEVGLFSSGSLGENFSYFTELPIAISHGETTIEVNDIHILYTDALHDGSGDLNFRFGKMRFFIPFIPNTLLSNADPLVYGYSALGSSRTAANDLKFADPTFGVSAFGMFPQILDGLRWEIGATGGTKSDIDLKSAHAFFASLNQTIYLDNAPLRIGAIYYGGSQDVSDTTITPNPWTNKVSRAGIDAEISDPWTKRVNLFGEYLIALDDNTDNAVTAHRMSGGFLGINVIIAPERFYFYGRYDYMSAHESGDIQKQIDFGFHYHARPNVVFIAGCTVMSEMLPQSVDQTTLTLGLGVLFGF